MTWILVGVGLVLLLVAGDFLVKGAVNLALRLGISALVVSLTVVAFGTSAPELLIVLSAMADNAPGIAMGNVVGSNTANVLLVLGLPALVAGLATAHCETRKAFVFMLLGTLLFIGLAFIGPFTWWHGLILLGALSVILWDQFRTAKKDRAAAKELEEPEGADPEMRGWKIAIYLVLGIVGLPIGANLLVHNAEIIALDFGVSQTAIGLTLVAIGTSLPELATTVVAAIRKQAEVALGNVIGSNMFNLLAIIGIAALIGPIPVLDQFLTFDLWIMLGASLLLIPFVFFSQNITRVWGGILTVLYLTYMVVVFL